MQLVIVTIVRVVGDEFGVVRSVRTAVGLEAAMSGTAFEPTLTVGAVAQRFGIAVSTLRSWDRRYGLGPTQHAPGRHRRYAAQDLQRLRRMISLTHEGVPPAAAARVALGTDSIPSSIRDGGGSGSVAVGRADRAVRGLTRAAGRLDVAAVRSLTESHLAQRGVRRTWEQLLVPVLTRLGENFRQGADVVATEHAATTGILGALHGIPPPPQHQRLPALLACAPEEQHGLPLEALAAALGEHGHPARFLGTRMPVQALCDATEKLRPTCVVVWAHAPHLARRVPLDRLARRVSLLLPAGPGWHSVRAARDHWCPLSLGEAVDAITDATGIFSVSTGNAHPSPQR